MSTPVIIPFDPTKEGEMVFTLKWNNERSLVDRLFGRPMPVLALGCYYVTDFGGKSLIDRLQFVRNSGPKDSMSRQGSYTMVPYIWHEGTDRADAGECTESIIVNYAKIPKLRRLTLYAFVLVGKPRWKRINPQLTIEIPGEQPRVLDFAATPKRKRRVYAIADIEVKDQELCLSPLLTLHAGHRDCNDTYDWGLNVAP